MPNVLYFHFVAAVIAFAGLEEYKSPIGGAPCGLVPSDERYQSRPSVDGGKFRFVGGEEVPHSGAVSKVTSPVYDLERLERLEIGTLPDMTASEAVDAVRAASAAWDRGQGQWPQMTLAARIAAIERLVEQLRFIRTELIEVLMWEIAKTRSDATKEFDRTMDFIAAVIEQLKTDPSGGSFRDWTVVSGVGVRVRRGPIGVMLGLAPYNYPLNEMYAMLIPSLLMGNVCVLKLPSVGGLVHVLTARAFREALPPGVLNFVSGSGRVTLGPIMETGLVDVLGVIGGVGGADALIKAHPHPHRLKVFAQLEAKNLGIVLSDADLEVAVEQCVLGATSYNGQRCTAIKLIMVHESIADEFVSRLVKRVSALKGGLPWEKDVAITPLPESGKPKFLEGLIADALARGASIANEAAGGGRLHGALMTPAVLDDVTSEMRIFHEEQFGPVVPVARFRDISEVRHAITASWNGQQAAIFTSDPEAAAPIVDTLSTVVGRINVNMQCGRSPDSVPFSGRRSSAMGTMSVSEVLRAFSVETVVAFTAKDEVASKVATGLDAHAAIFAPV
jgi:glyceraldehyde-3-phosphate dehydrogenase (NADP+)